MARKKRPNEGRSSDEKKRKLTAKEMLAIGKRISKHLKGKVIDHAECLYDEKGLPK